MIMQREEVIEVRIRFSTQFIGGATVGAKNEALFPGRVPHVRQSVHPDFLSRSLALTTFMRLSLMKAAHAPVGGAPCRKSGTMGRKRILQMLSLHVQGLLLLVEGSPV